MPAPRYVDAVRRPAPKEGFPQKRGGTGRGSPSQGTAASSAGQTTTALPHTPRFIFAFAATLGERVVVQVKNGDEFEGTLHGPHLGSKNIQVILKDARKLVKDINGGNEERIYETLVISSYEFVQMKAEGIHIPSIENEAQSTKQTSQNDATSKTGSELTEEREYQVLPTKDDGNIAGFTGDIDNAQASRKITERTLVAWNGGEGSQEDVVLEGDTGDWCQFSEKTNAGIKSTFRMEDYTSKVDASRSLYTETEADRIAAEIEAGTHNREAHVLDDSGVAAEKPEAPFVEAEPPPATKKKAISWVDAVKRRPTPVGQRETKPTATRSLQKAAVIDTPPETPSRPTVQFEDADPAPIAATHVKYQDPPVDSPAVQRLPETEQPAFSSAPDPTSSSSPLAHGKEAPTVFRKMTYPVSSCDGDPAITMERLPSFQDTTNETDVDKSHDVEIYREQVWMPPPAHWPIAVRTSSNDFLEQDRSPRAEESAINPTTASPSVSKSETRKPASTVVPGMSFKDVVKANLPTSVVKPLTPTRPRVSHIQTKSSGNVTEATKETIVRSPRAKSFSGKLISNARPSNLPHADAKKSLPSEEHLLSPMTIPHHMMYPPPHGMVPMSGGMIPHPMPPGPFSDIHPGAGPPPMPYGGYMPPPIDAGHFEMIPQPGPLPPVQQPPAVEGVNRDDDDSEKRGGGRFQLNPNAKAYKPVMQVDERGQMSPTEQQSASTFVPTPTAGEFEASSQRVSEVPSPHAAPVPPAAGPLPPQPGQHIPVAPDGPPPVDYKGPPPPHPGARPPFVAQSNVVTPWPSFPGTGVWHSTIGPPRPGAPPSAMINGYMPPGMPPPYPMMMPGPVPFTGGMQEPMWRGPPMPRGMPDQQGLAMMWQNFYSQVVPPNQRMYNPAKFQGGPGPMSRPVKGYRRPATGSNHQGPPPPSNFPVQAPDTQPSGEMP